MYFHGSAAWLSTTHVCPAFSTPVSSQNFPTICYTLSVLTLNHRLLSTHSLSLLHSLLWSMTQKARLTFTQRSVATPVAASSKFRLLSWFVFTELLGNIAVCVTADILFLFKQRQPMFVSDILNIILPTNIDLENINKESQILLVQSLHCVFSKAPSLVIYSFKLVIHYSYVIYYLTKDPLISVRAAMFLKWVSHTFPTLIYSL